MSARDAVDEHRTSHHRSEWRCGEERPRDALAHSCPLVCEFHLAVPPSKAARRVEPVWFDYLRGREAARPHIDSRGAQAGKAGSL